MKKTLEDIISSRRLPKDELDGFWDNFLGFIPAVLFLMAGIAPLISPNTTMGSSTIFIIAALGILIFSYTLFAKITERNLKTIKTGLSKEENEILISKISQSENWSKLTNKDHFHSFYIPFVWFHYGFKLTLIPIDKGVLINFRNRGTVQARMPYQFGIETFKQKVIEKRIKDYSRQRITKVL